ncbi:unnamed protein product [Fusarium venenatum]|uniref:Uncharacterized protein n=1 Tax=Fusarium venenatum TaxID=56646 RepID=A0A2L2TNG5_9HYPO|nr:LOW QUALITY PROTEIN: uncharacterized protein FVRRES_05291 [Fusarium venenatum]CEI60855.1 unnamed protein product [Fusarium venenatum]
MYRLRDLDTSSGRQQREIQRFTDWLCHLQGFDYTVLITRTPTVVKYYTSRRGHSLQRAVPTLNSSSPPGLAHAVTVPGIQNYAIARRCHLPPFPPPPIEQTSSPSCSISPSKSVPSDSLKSALDRNKQSINDPQSGRSGIHLHLATFHSKKRKKEKNRLILFCRLTVQKKRVTVLNSTTNSSTRTHSAALPGSSPVQSSPAKPSREPKPESTNLASHPGFCPSLALTQKDRLLLSDFTEKCPVLPTLSDSSCQSVSPVSQSVSGPRCILILHHHYPSLCRLIQSPFFLLSSFLCLLCLSIYLPITLLLCSNSISVTATVPTTLLYILSLSTVPPVSPGYSPLQPSISSFATLTHSLCVPVTNWLLVILALLCITIPPNQAQATAAHTLSRSLRDRQLAPAYYTPPPNLLGLATVQTEKSHIPPRQAVTHHLDASRLAP